MKKALAASEFWVALIAAGGQFASSAGWIPAEQWKSLFEPALVYIVARVISKVAKKAAP